MTQSVGDTLLALLCIVLAMKPALYLIDRWTRAWQRAATERAWRRAIKRSRP